MSGWKTVAVIVAIALLAIAAGFFAGYSLKKEKTEIVYIDVPHTVHDTVEVKVDPASYHNIPGKPTKPSPAEPNAHPAGGGQAQPPTVPSITVASVDTTLRSDDIDFGHLFVSYNIPSNLFNITFAPAPRETIVTTKYIYKETPWYAKPYVSFIVGAAIGVTAERLR